jgi:actin-related protein 8
VLHGVVMRSLGLEIMGQGAMTLTVHLSELMHQSGLRFASMYTARTLKEVSLNALIFTPLRLYTRTTLASFDKQLNKFV